tara:strand:- start:962 stop:1366 length:405 start_codon:yes stop_codon:yes gene_type:complete
MLLTTHFQTAIKDFSKLALHGAMKTDARITGPFYKAAQDFVIAAEQANITQNNVPTVKSLDIDSLQDKVKTVQIFANAVGNVDVDIKNAVQDLVDHLKAREITATSNPYLNAMQNAPKIDIKPQSNQPLWGPKA